MISVCKGCCCEPWHWRCACVAHIAAANVGDDSATLLQATVTQQNYERLQSLGLYNLLAHLTRSPCPFWRQVHMLVQLFDDAAFCVVRFP